MKGLGSSFSSVRLHSCLIAFVSMMGVQQLVAQEAGDQYSSEAIRVGLRVFSQQCTFCHGPQGDLVNGVNLRLGQFKTVKSDDDLMRVITKGAGDGQMPAFTLSDRELKGVIAYIRAGFNLEAVKPV